MVILIPRELAVELFNRDIEKKLAELESSVILEAIQLGVPSTIPQDVVALNLSGNHIDEWDAVLRGNHQLSWELSNAIEGALATALGAVGRINHKFSI